MSMENGTQDSGPWEQSGQEQGPVWTFRGYRLSPSDFTNSMVHMYRAEVGRASVWRQRLDSTTNWAVLTTAAALSFAFGSEQTSHIVILLSTMLVTLFLFIEARRYRYYELWSYRTRLMETDYFAAMLVPPFGPDDDWSETFAETLLHPQFPITKIEALGRRLRRSYLPIYMILAVAWISNITLRPSEITSWEAFIAHAGIGLVPGTVVMAAVGIFYTALFVVSVFSRGLTDATGEVLPRYNSSSSLHAALDNAGAAEKRGRKAWFRPSHRRQQLLSLIITNKPQAVADALLEKMHRGITGMDGEGMYSGTSIKVLMCALTVTEVPRLKSIVRKTDPEAMVIVTPAQEVIGGDFDSLKSD